MNRRGVLLGGGAIAVAGVGAAASWIQMGSEADRRAMAGVSRAVLAQQPELTELVRYATLAANGHNTQPWRFRISPRSIALSPDFSRRTPVVDPDDHHLYVSLGGAAENLMLAAGARGLPGALRFDPESEGTVVLDFTSGVSSASSLFDAIPHRQSTRTEYDGRPVNTADLRALASSVALVPGVDLVLAVEPEQIDRFRDMLLAANTVQMADAAFIAELKRWVRFNPRDALRTGDGLYAAASGTPSLPTWLGRPLFDLMFKPDAENAKYARHVRSSSGVAIIVGREADRAHWVDVGRACQRFLLQATALGLKFAFLNQPVEVAKFRPGFASVIGVPGRRPDIALRFGYGPTLPYSLRRPVDAVIV